MKLSVDEKNRRVIAIGSYKGKKIKAIAVCHPEDNFNAEIGKEIATLKYQIKEEETKRAIHESNVRALHEHIMWAYRVLDNETKIVNNMLVKIEKLKKKNEEKINNIV
jgi:hypothetical protein